MKFDNKSYLKKKNSNSEAHIKPIAFRQAVKRVATKLSTQRHKD